jgi:hypothetical protein
MSSLDGPGFSITLLSATGDRVHRCPNKDWWPIPSFFSSIWQDKASRVFHEPNAAEADDFPAKGGIKLGRSPTESTIDIVLVLSEGVYAFKAKFPRFVIISLLPNLG